MLVFALIVCHFDKIVNCYYKIIVILLLFLVANIVKKQSD